MNLAACQPGFERVGRSAVLAVGLLLALGLCAGCRADQATLDASEAVPSRPGGPSITLGDVEADEPLRRIRWIQPLADYLAENLSEHGIDTGRVVVARDLDEMARLLRDGEVDIYLDSPLPAMKVAGGSGAEIILRRWVKDQPEYWSLVLTHRESGLGGWGQLSGRTIAFQERHSTTGFLLPAYALLDRGFQLQVVTDPAATTEPGQIGCWFTGDEENSVQLLVDNAVTAAVVSNQDYEELPAEKRDLLRTLMETQSVPRQVVVAGPGLDPALRAKVRQLLLGLSDEDRARLAATVDGGGWTWRFDELPPASLEQLERYSEALAGLVLD